MAADPPAPARTGGAAGSKPEGRGGLRRVPQIFGGTDRRPDDVGTGAAAPASGLLIRVHQAAARFFRGRLPGSWVPGYLARRGFGTGVQRRWQAGYAPGAWHALTRHLRDLGYHDAVIEAAGLAHLSGRGTLIDTFRDRAMLPIRAGDGTIVGFIGRAADDADPDVPTYINSPRTVLYRKGDVLFGLSEARGQFAAGARPVLVEGPFDAIAVTTAGSGRYAGVAPCGTAFTAAQAAALAAAVDLRVSGVLVAFDADRAGRRGSVKAYHLLAPLTAILTAVSIPASGDPAQILRDHGPAALAATLERATQPLADLVIDAQADRWSRWRQYPEGQIGALRGTAPLIAAMPPAHVARQVARLARRLGLDYATVTEAVTDAVPGTLALAQDDDSAA